MSEQQRKYLPSEVEVGDPKQVSKKVNPDTRRTERVPNSQSVTLKERLEQVKTDRERKRKLEEDIQKSDVQKNREVARAFIKDRIATRESAPDGSNGSVSEQLARKKAERDALSVKKDVVPEIPEDSLEIQKRIVAKQVEDTRLFHKGIDSLFSKGSISAEDEEKGRVDLSSDERIAIAKARIEAIDESNKLADKYTKSPESPDAGFHRAMSAKDSQVAYDSLKKEDSAEVKEYNDSFDEQMETAHSAKAQKYADKLEKKAEQKGLFATIKRWFR